MKPTFGSSPFAGRVLAKRLPLIRLLSCRLTGFLAPSGITPNQLTIVGVLAGLAAALCYLRGGTIWALAGAVLFFVYYLLDNCDGELARLRGLQSRLGAQLDDIGDWAVHAALFLAIGFHEAQTSGQAVWMWLGGVAAVGGTINSLLLFANGSPRGEEEVSHLSDLPEDASRIDVAGFVLRGLIKADFWLIVSVLTAADAIWILLPAGAIGSQVFWLLYLRKTARRVHT